MSLNALLQSRKKSVKRLAKTTNPLVTNEKCQKSDRSNMSSDCPLAPSVIPSRDFELTKVVEALKQRYLSGQFDPVTLDELIETFHLKIDEYAREWLLFKALPQNERVDTKRIENTHKFVYKPPLGFNVQKKIHLVNLIKSRHEQCETAVTVDDVRETLPAWKADKFITSLVERGDVVKVKNSQKNEVLLYTDRDNNLNVNKEFVKEWRKTSVEELDDDKLWDYINSQGYYGLKKKTARHTQISKKPVNVRRRVNITKHNEHVADRLIDFLNSH